MSPENEVNNSVLALALVQKARKLINELQNTTVGDLNQRLGNLENTVSGIQTTQGQIQDAQLLINTKLNNLATHLGVSFDAEGNVVV